jgi:hypothetical protein
VKTKNTLKTPQGMGTNVVEFFRILPSISYFYGTNEEWKWRSDREFPKGFFFLVTFHIWVLISNSRFDLTDKNKKRLI